MLIEPIIRPIPTMNHKPNYKDNAGADNDGKPDL